MSSSSPPLAGIKRPIDEGNNVNKAGTVEEAKDGGAFVASMTFAQQQHNFDDMSGCCCEECGRTTWRIPSPIANAIRSHKRRMIMKRTQERTLIRRQQRGGCVISLYKLAMPIGAEPLVEFGNSHRFIWIRSLPKSDEILSIGKRGIIGSRDEETSRVEMGWKQGQVYLVPSNGGKAVGWIHTSPESSSSSSTQSSENDEAETSGYGILYVLKIVLGSVADGDENEENEDNNSMNSSWKKKLEAIITDKTAEPTTTKQSNDSMPKCYLLEDKESDLLKNAMKELEGSDN